jgi:hypothetical protein
MMFEPCFSPLFEDKQSSQVGESDECQKEAKIPIKLWHLLTCFISYLYVFPHFYVHICFIVFLLSLSNSQPFVVGI